MILTALTLSAAAPLERWLHVSESPRQYQEYVDTQSIQRSGDTVTLWTRRDLLFDAGTVWTELELDCGKRTETVLAFIKDDGSSVSHNTARPHRPAAPIAPRSVAENIFNLVCR
jgi:hypothetical protein